MTPTTHQPARCPWRHWIAACAFALAALLTAGLVPAAIQSANAPRSALPPWANQPTPPGTVFAELARPFTLHWAGRTPLRGDASRARSVPVDFGSAAVRRDVVLLSDLELPSWPSAGLHEIIERPGRLSAILDELPDQAARVLHDNWDGLIIIDFRGWTPLWERYPATLKDRFRRALRQAHPEEVQGLSSPQIEQTCAAAFDTLNRALYLGTIEALRNRWPRAKVSFSFVPPMIFGMDPLLPKATMGYGEHWPNAASTLNDRLRWLVDGMDFVTLTILPWAISTREGEKSDYSRGTIDPVLNWRYLASNLRESVRMARGKPVYALSSFRYAQDWGRMTGRPPLIDLDLHQLLSVTMMDPAVRGLIVCDELRTPGELTAWEEDLARRIWPATRDVAARWNLRLPIASDPLPTWPNVGNLARAGQTLPPAFSPDLARERFRTDESR